MNDYIKNIREVIGTKKIIHPAARIIIESKEGQFLFIKRKDNGKLGVIAGAFENNETIEQCIIREVFEESGLVINYLEVIGISTDPNLETVKYPNQDEIQYFVIEFYTNDWTGELKVDQNEVMEAFFLGIEHVSDLPKNEQSIFESLHYFRKHQKISVR
ncbi:MAG: NUDIX domain-containing protein [Chitinophagales bacterium]|nr:NUDIX domain-containing protein [Chitinophagales bacterium]